MSDEGLPTAVVVALGEQVEGLAKRVERLTEANSLQKKVIRWLKWVTVAHVVVTLAITTGGLAIRTISQCQAAWNKSFVAGLAERTDAAGTEREANQIRWALLIDALRNPVPNPTPEQREQLTKRWLDDLTRANQLLAEADAKRAANPIPPQPNCE